MGFRAVWWEAYGDTEHRMLHWPQLVSLANSSPSASSQSIASMVQREVAAQLPGSGVDKSRTPKLRDHVNHTISKGWRGHLQLTGPCSSWSRLQEQRKGKRKGEESRSGKTSTSRHDLEAPRPPQRGEAVTKLFYQSQANTICYAFQEGTCQQHVATTSASACRPAWRPFPEPLPHSLLCTVLLRPLLSHTSSS